jgi:hypothetical protein
MSDDLPLPQLRFAIGEAAQILSISRVTLYQRINAGLITSYLIKLQLQHRRRNR